MKQISIKNQCAAELLEQVSRLTGQGKTETIIHALELYRAKLLADREIAAVVASIKEHIHPHIRTEYRGKRPTEAEIEADLGMP